MVGEPGDVPRCSGNLWPVVAGAALWLVDVGGEACAAASGCASTARPHPTEPHLANPRHSPPTRAGDDRARTGAARSPLRGTVGLRANPRYHRIRDADAPSCTQGGYVSSRYRAGETQPARGGPVSGGSRPSRWSCTRPGETQLQFGDTATLLAGDAGLRRGLGIHGDVRTYGCWRTLGYVYMCGSTVGR